MTSVGKRLQPERRCAAAARMVKHLLNEQFQLADARVQVTSRLSTWPAASPGHPARAPDPVPAPRATAILAFTVYTIGALEAEAAGAPLLAGISALLLLLLLRGATVAGRRHGNR